MAPYVYLGRVAHPFSPKFFSHSSHPLKTSFDVLGNVITPSMDQRDISSSQKAHEVTEFVSLERRGLP